MKHFLSRLCLAASLSLGASLNVHAQSPASVNYEAKELVVTVYESIDDNADGKATIEEMSRMGEEIFVSMDYDDNVEISHLEFMEWDFGLINVSVKTGQSKTYNTAKKILFALRDIDSNGVISETENRNNILSDFSRADINSDGAISKSEYLNAYIPTLVFKAAFKVGAK